MGGNWKRAALLIAAVASVVGCTPAPSAPSSATPKAEGAKPWVRDDTIFCVELQPPAYATINETVQIETRVRVLFATANLPAPGLCTPSMTTINLSFDCRPEVHRYELTSCPPQNASDHGCSVPLVRTMTDCYFGQAHVDVRATAPDQTEGRGMGDYQAPLPEALDDCTGEGRRALAFQAGHRRCIQAPSDVGCEESWVPPTINALKAVWRDRIVVAAALHPESYVRNHSPSPDWNAVDARMVLPLLSHALSAHGSREHLIALMMVVKKLGPKATSMQEALLHLLAAEAHPEALLYILEALNAIGAFRDPGTRAQVAPLIAEFVEVAASSDFSRSAADLRRQGRLLDVDKEELWFRTFQMKVEAIAAAFRAPSNGGSAESQAAAVEARRDKLALSVAVRACYVEQLAKDPSFNGTLTITWKVAQVLPWSAPTASLARITKTTVRGPVDAEACAVRAVNGWSFSKEAFPTSTLPREVQWMFRMGGDLVPQP